MLRKMMFLAGAGVGYVLGTRAGRERYEAIRELARDTAERADVHQAVEKAAPLAGKVKTMARGKIPGTRAEQADAGAIADAAPPAAPAADGSSAAEGDANGHERPTGGAPILVTPAGMDEAGGAAHEASHEPSNLPPRGTFSPTLGIF